MLARVLEPEVMDSFEDARDYDSMDHRAVNERFVEDLLAAWRCRPESQAAPPAGTDDRTSPPVDVLDLGTGTAQIPIVLCRSSADFRVLAVDAAASMLHLARGNIEIMGLTARIRLDLVDAKSLPFENDRFSLVMSNSIVHHLPDPQPALAEAIRVTANGGLIFFRDLARPESDDEVTRLVEMYAADANPHQRQLFDASLRAALSLQEMQSLVAALGFDPADVTQTSDRHWTWSAWKLLAA